MDSQFERLTLEPDYRTPYPPPMRRRGLKSRAEHNREKYMQRQCGCKREIVPDPFANKRTPPETSEPQQ